MSKKKRRVHRISDLVEIGRQLGGAMRIQLVPLEAGTDDAFAMFRRELRALLYEHGVPSNPGWSEADIVSAFKALLAAKDRPA